MQEFFGVVVFAVVAVAAIGAIASLFGRRSLYDQIGRGGLSLDRDDRGGVGGQPAGSAAVESAEREVEVRQMLAARSARRVRRGQAPLDVDAAAARLLHPSPAADPTLVAEVRAHVIARNERRERRGEPPLDVEREVARQLERLGGL